MDNEQSQPFTGKNSWEELAAQVKELIANRELERAEIVALQALAVAETFSLDDRRQGVSLELLTEILYQTKNYPYCAPFLVRLLEMYKRCLGPGHPDTGTIMHNVAMLYHSWGKYSEADYYYREAIKAKSKHFNKDSPEIADVTKHYAQLREAMVPETTPTRIAIQRVTNKLRRTGQFAAMTKNIPDDEFTTDG